MALMEALEAVAREKALTVLVLDTSTGSGAGDVLSESGLAKGGEIPRYAPDAERGHDGDLDVL